MSNHQPSPSNPDTMMSEKKLLVFMRSRDYFFDFCSIIQKVIISSFFSLRALVKFLNGEGHRATQYNNRGSSTIITSKKARRRDEKRSRCNFIFINSSSAHEKSFALNCFFGAAFSVYQKKQIVEILSPHISMNEKSQKLSRDCKECQNAS